MMGNETTSIPLCLGLSEFSCHKNVANYCFPKFRQNRSEPKDSLKAFQKEMNRLSSTSVSLCFKQREESEILLVTRDGKLNRWFTGNLAPPYAPVAHLRHRLLLYSYPHRHVPQTHHHSPHSLSPISWRITPPRVGDSINIVNCLSC